MVGDSIPQRHHCRPVLSYGHAKKGQSKNKLRMLLERGSGDISHYQIWENIRREVKMRHIYLN